MNTQNVIDELESRLRQDEWSVELAEQSGCAVVVQHELSGSLKHRFGDEPIDRGKVEEFLERQEFTRIRERPRDMPHAELVGQLRSAVSVFNADPRVMVVIAQVLGAHDVLTSEESEWLASAPSAWAD